MFQPVQKQMTIVPVGVVADGSVCQAKEVLQQVLRCGHTPRFLAEKSFQEGFSGGYTWEEESGEFEEVELTFAAVLELVEQCLSYAQHYQETLFHQHLGIEPLPYAYHVAFVLGWLRWMFDAGRAPSVPAALLSTWLTLERFTAQVAAHFLAVVVD